MSGECTIVVCGCGTAGYWVTRSLVRPPTMELETCMVFCDRAEIREANVITCPEYATSGQPKSARLARLARRWSHAGIDARAVQGSVERLAWNSILSGVGKTLVIMGLDNWPSRLTVAEDVRRFCASRHGTYIPIIQIGLDCGQASVAVFGSDFDDPCPACGLPSLPDPEPCVLMTADGKLLRGNLHAEAQTAARFVGRITHDCLALNRVGRWINTKTNLILTREREQGPNVFTRRCRKVRGCLGPHDRATPVRWSDLLDSITSNQCA